MKPEKPHRKKFYSRPDDSRASQYAVGALFVMTLLYAATIV
jgi:hypothetical protein